MTTTKLNKILSSHKYNGGIKQYLLDNYDAKISLNLLESNTIIINKEVDRKRLYIREALLINELKPA